MATNVRVILLALLWSGWLEAAPNVIVVMGDDIGYGELSCHGNPVLRTPQLDRLHGESVRLTDFHVAPMCTPTRGQLMTGVDALRNRAMNVSSGRSLLRADLPTMAEIFARSGYATGLFGKWHLGDNHPYRPQDRGFQEVVTFESSYIGAAADFWGNDYFDDTYMHNGRPRQYQGYSTDVFFTEAMSWMRRQQEAGKPFLLYLPPAAAHAPHVAPQQYVDTLTASIAANPAATEKMAPAERQELAKYLAMIANLDDNMGRLDAFLRETGLLDDTILIFLTDNGSTFGHKYYNAGMRDGKMSLLEGGHRVPCFIRWPKGALKSGGDVANLTQVQDLLPTLLDFAEIPAPVGAKFDGRSLATALRVGSDPALRDRTQVVQFSRMAGKGPHNAAQLPAEGDAAVLWQRWRLVGNALYNLEEDPAQTRDVSAAHPEIAARLRAHYDAWWEPIAPGLNEPLRISIGHANAPEVRLTPADWFDSFLDQGIQIRNGINRFGTWHLQVATAGTYEFELRRWPRECDAAISGSGPGGQALPVAKARLAIADFDQTMPVRPADKAVNFRVPLPAGPFKLDTWFLNGQNNPIASAYFVHVRRVN